MCRLVKILYAGGWFFAYIGWLIINEILIQQQPVGIKMLTDLSVMCLSFLCAKLLVCYQKFPLYIVVGYGIIVACMGATQTNLDINAGAEWIQVLLPSNPAVWGAWSGVGLLTVIALWQEQRKRHIVWIVLCTSLLALLLFSSSRASWMGVMIGSAFFWNWSRIVRYMKAHLFVALLCFFAVIAGCWGLYRYKQASADGRALIWKVSLNLIAKHPLTGQGQDAFRHHYLYAQADYFAQHPQAKEAIYADNVIYPYNELIKIVVESGLIGMILFVGLLVSAMMHKKQTFENKSLSVLLLFMCVYGMFAYPSDVWSLKVLFFALLGSLSVDEAMPTKRKQMTYSLALLLSAVICMGVIHYAQLKYRVERPVVRGIAGKEPPTGWWQSLSDYPALYEHCVQQCVLSAPSDTVTLQMLEAATRYIPSSSLFCYLGDCNLTQGKAGPAEACYRQANRMVPGRFLPHYKLFDLYRKSNRHQDAYEEAHAILSLPVKVDNTLTLKIRGEAKRFLRNMNNKEKN